MKKYVYEIFDEFKAAESMEDKIAVLQRNATPELKMVLRGTFHPNIEYTITKVPNYRPSHLPIGFSSTSINQELRRIYLFEKNNPRKPANFDETAANRILVQILEAMEKNEATVFINMLLKDQKIADLNQDLVEKAFPGLFHV